MGHAVDYADIYFQSTREESWALEDGIVKDGAHSIEQGVGVRALAGEKTGFAYSDEVMLPALLEAAHAARAISRLWLERLGAGLARDRRPQALSADRSGRLARRSRQGQAARGDRSRGAFARFAHHAGHGESFRFARYDSRHGERRHAGGGRAPAGATERQRHHRARGSTRAGLRRRRRALCLHRIPGLAALAQRWCAKPCAPRRSISRQCRRRRAR